MKNHIIVTYTTENYLPFLKELKASFLHYNFQFSIADLQLIQDLTQAEVEIAIRSAIEICRLAGINSSTHFKKIYVFDSHSKTVSMDWRMSKTAFNLVMMQLQKINYNNALWFYKLADR